MAISVKKDVIQFQVTINDSSRVKKEESNSNLCSVEDRYGFLEFALELNLKHQVSSINIFHDKVKTIHGLKTGMKLNKEWRLLRQRKDSLFNHRTLDVIILNNDVLLQYLDCIKFICVLSLCQHDFSEGSFSENHNKIEV